MSLTETFERRYPEIRNNLEGKNLPVPEINLFPLDKEKERTRFFQKLSNLPKQEHLKPWASQNPEDIIVEAMERGLFVDTFREQLQDYAKTRRLNGYFNSFDHSKILKKYLDQYDNWQYGTIAEYPWVLKGRFVRLLPHEDFYKVAFSRNRFVISDETQQKLRKTKIAIAGLGVGTACGYLLILSGAENLTVWDGGDQDLHDTNRLIGAKTREIGINQAIRFARLALETNPYANISCHPQNLERSNIQWFLDGVGLVIEETDFLPVKVGVREMSHQKNITVCMATDLGKAGLTQIETPKSLIFDGRLTKEVTNQLLDPNIDFRTKTALASEVIIGTKNVPLAYFEAVAKAQEAKVSFWPQPGLSAYLSASMLVETIIEILEGKEINYELLVNLQELVSKPNPY